MLDSRITKKKKRKKKKMEKKVKTLRILTSWFEIRGKEEKCMGWCKNYGNSCTVWSEAVEIFKRIRKGQGSQILLFADNWNEEISEAIRCFVFATEYFIPVFLMGQTLTFDE